MAICFVAAISVQNPIECRGACVNVTGMRSLERAMKIVANAAVHKSTSFCSTCAGQAAVGPIPGGLSSGEGRVRTPLPLGQHCYLQSKEINKSVTVPSTSSAKAGMMIAALELTSSKWRRLTISTSAYWGMWQILVSGIPGEDDCTQRSACFGLSSNRHPVCLDRSRQRRRIECKT